MNKFETISQTYMGGVREVDGQPHRPLKIHNVALTTPFSHNHYPLSLFSLSGAVSRRQPDLHEMTLARTQDADELITFVKTNSPDILALSAPQGTLETLDQTLEGLKRFVPEQIPQIILGGSLPTYLSDRFFKKYPQLPLIIVGGWGENAFADEVRLRSVKDSEPQQRFINGIYSEHYPKQEGVPNHSLIHPSGDLCLHLFF